MIQRIFNSSNTLSKGINVNSSNAHTKKMSNTVRVLNISYYTAILPLFQSFDIKI